MLRLPSTAPRWSDLPRGVRVMHRPATPADVKAASAWAQRRAGEMADAMRDRLSGHETAPDDISRLEWGFFSIALGRLCITGWDGVDGECGGDGVEALLTLPDMAVAWVEIAMADVSALRDEGNASAPAPSGITAGAQNTAKDAEQAA